MIEKLLHGFLVQEDALLTTNNMTQHNSMFATIHSDGSVAGYKLTNDEKIR